MKKRLSTIRSAHAAVRTLIAVCVLDGAGIGATEVGGSSIPTQPAQLPVDTATATTIRLEASGSVDLTSYFVQPDGQHLQYAAEAVDSTLVSVTMSGSRLAVSTPVTGTVYVDVRATDSQGRTAARVFRVIVARRRDFRA